ncbi:MAG TPA: DJ-1/PfpI family protein [Anaerolineaceae bacterium]|nr:DJ-1/PfpI family protein [Anaerolineaceae bacterium]HPN54135.1 DJ-1/PfpI family protein [Anaerolineaceae bacterium]
MKIGFLLFDDVEELDFAGPWELFSSWSERDETIECLTVSQHMDMIRCANGLKVLPDTDFEFCPALDLLLVPGGQGTRREVNNPELVSFVQRQAASCKWVLSVCTGAFVLQAAGLLKGKKATTHWQSLDRLRAFPEVIVVEERFVRDDPVWTAAGVSAGMDLALAVIAELAGSDMAGRVQLGAEYYPRQVRYGSAHLSDQAPGYLRE